MNPHCLRSISSRRIPSTQTLSSYPSHMHLPDLSSGGKAFSHRGTISPLDSSVPLYVQFGTAAAFGGSMLEASAGGAAEFSRGASAGAAEAGEAAAAGVSEELREHARAHEHTQSGK